MKNLSWYIANRISFANNGKSSSPSVIVAIIGVALSITIMLSSVAIVLGFQREIKNKVIGFNSHITLSPTHLSEELTDNIIDTTQSIGKILDNKNYIINWSLTCSTPAIFKTKEEFKGIYLHGVDSDYDFGFLFDNIVSGEIPQFNNHQNINSVMISSKIASQMGLNVGDSINTYFINPNVRLRQLRVAAIYNTHFEDYDNLFVYANSAIIRELNNLTNSQGTSIEVHVDDFNNVAKYADDINSSVFESILTGEMKNPLHLTTAIQSGASYWGWLALLDTNVVVIIILMTIVSCFTLISGMLILILEKISFIGLMKSLGASNKLIRNIFIKLSLRIALIGLIIGNFFTLILLYVQKTYHLIKLDPQSYYIDFVPVEIDTVNTLIINALILIIIWLILILPSHVAVKISPAKTIRYE